MGFIIVIVLWVSEDKRKRNQCVIKPDDLNRVILLQVVDLLSWMDACR